MANDAITERHRLDTRETPAYLNDKVLELKSRFLTETSRLVEEATASETMGIDGTAIETLSCEARQLLEEFMHLRDLQQLHAKLSFMSLAPYASAASSMTLVDQRIRDNISDRLRDANMTSLVLSPNGPQEILECICDALPKFRQQFAGILLGNIMRRSSELCYGHRRQAMRDQDVTIDLSALGPLNGIGTHWQSGHLNVVGDAGDYLGLFGTGGTITAEAAGDYAGYSAKGIEITLDEAGNHLGDKLQGGKIYAGTAGDSVGFEQTGGEIHVTHELGNIADRRTGGKVFGPRGLKDVFVRDGQKLWLGTKRVRSGLKQ